MSHSLLPIEIWEHIIDSCHSGLLRKWGEAEGSYATWRQTALVCSAWHPRSRLNLLYHVKLVDSSNVDLLLRTLVETPHVADLIVRLTVDGSGQYVPFARMPLPLLLKKCVALNLLGIDWNQYPPRYADTGLYRWSGVVELCLKVRSSVLRASLRFIWSLQQLHDLSLSWSGDVGLPTEKIRSTMMWPGPKITTNVPRFPGQYSHSAVLSRFWNWTS
ncbi:hypothetical protein C8Q76DRAFT_177661 [Earliella scabrosa]|nr:hypothetical protein C8Q76DRAFT_177661 [Earliella scabrosa]